MAEPSQYDSEVFRLAIAAGFYHPDPAARSSLRAVLDTWLDGLGSSPDPGEITALLSAETGTAIEPFVLTKDDLECATFLARASFSRTVAHTRFRIVSRETIGHDGGLVLTSNLRSFYSERYIHRKNQHLQTSGWTFIPSALPAAGANSPSMINATVSSEEEGFRIVVPIRECRHDPATFARSLQKNSRIQGTDDSFSSLGLRVECHGRDVHVLTGSPESMIRVMAHMVGNSTLVLKGDSSAPEIPVTLVRLEIPENGPLPIRALIGSTTAYASWMLGEVPSQLHLADEHKLLISTAIRPHPEWIDSAFATLS